MEKKVFFQVSVILYILLIFLLAIFVGAIYVVIWFPIEKFGTATGFEWAGFIASILAVFFISYTFIRMAKNRIILDANEIYVPEHWGSKDHKVQYETHIRYSDIKEIYIVSSINNSFNKPLRWGVLPMPFIVFDCNDDEQKSICVFYFSKKQTILIIDEAIARAKTLGNNLQIQTGTELLSEFIQQSKSKKKK